MIGNKENFLIKLNGKSMAPLLHEQDEVIIKPISIDQIKCGDIVLFKDESSGELIVHRLIEFPFKTKGDYSITFEKNKVDSFLGLAVGVVRGDHTIAIPVKQKHFLFFSKLRLGNYFTRKVGLIGLIISATFFEFYNAKTK